MISQAGGKGVNISRASVAAGVPSIAVLPARNDDPFVLELLAAGIDCRPVPTAGRPAGQHHDHRARRHHHQAQQPRPDGDRRACSSRAHRGAAADAPQRRLGGAGRLAAAGRPRRVVRRPGGRPARHRAPASPSTPATRRCARSSTGSPDCRTAPDEAQRRGARLVHRRRRRRARVRPGGRRRAPLRPGRPRRRDRAGDAGPAAAPYSSPPRAPGTPLPRRPRWSAPSVPATPASSATSSGRSRAGPRPTTRARRRLRQRRRRPSRHDHPATPRRSVPSSSRSASSTSP